MRVDWYKLIDNLRGRVVLCDVSRKLGKHEDWLCQFRQRKTNEPSFSDGLKLLQIHAKACPDKRREIIKK